ncbi:MAG: hypothetical protein RL662_402 [Bacteroidota bacterium]|jgi:pimeloyl-ACP methyl ester carboxylesterase
MNFLLKSIFFLSLLTSSYACRDDNENTVYQAPIEERVIDTLTVEEIKVHYKKFLEITKSLSAVNIEAELAKIKYDVVFTTVKYSGEDPLGNKRTLSGLVGYPLLPTTSQEKKLRVASIQHGTLFSESQAPSKNNFKSINEIRDILTLVIPAHENGHIVVMPDYFGYGSDEAAPHYYEHRASLATASRGLIELMTPYTAQRKLMLSYDKLYLLGYSEGGFATMSTLKSFSENNSNFKDIITVSGAGAYDKEMTASRIVAEEEGDSPTFTASYSWVLLTYNAAYKINRSLDKLFEPAVLDEIKTYVGNDLIMQTQTLLPDPVKVFTREFSKGLINKTDTAYINAVRDNNVSDFDVKGSLDLVHGSADTWVPTYNTDSTYVRLKRRNINVEKTIVDGGTHASSYAVFAIKSLSKF